MKVKISAVTFNQKKSIFSCRSLNIISSKLNKFRAVQVYLSKSPNLAFLLWLGRLIYLQQSAGNFFAASTLIPFKAHTLGASVPTPRGFSLHAIRFNPLKGFCYTYDFSISRHHGGFYLFHYKCIAFIAASVHVNFGVKKTYQD